VIPASVRRIWHPLPFERRRAAREHATGGTSARLTLGGRYERQARLTACVSVLLSLVCTVEKEILKIGINLFFIARQILLTGRSLD
jgi:hypothetical protein